MKVRVFTAVFLAAVLSSAVNAEQLRQGATACRTKVAFEELNRAQLAGDKRAVQWLFSGAACVVMPKDTSVAVLESGDNGATHLRTTLRRRSVRLWAKAADLLQ